MPDEAPVPKDHPLMQAWEKFNASEEYANSFSWARHEQHRQGSMWAAFMAGWEAAQTPNAELCGGEAVRTNAGLEPGGYYGEQK